MPSPRSAGRRRFDGCRDSTARAESAARPLMLPAGRPINGGVGTNRGSAIGTARCGWQAANRQRSADTIPRRSAARRVAGARAPAPSRSARPRPGPGTGRTAPGSRTPGSTCTSKISSTPGHELQVGDQPARGQVHHADAALQLSAAARRSACRRTSRSRGSSTGRRTRTARTAPGRACSRAARPPSRTSPVAGSTSTSCPAPECEQPDPAAVDARRVRHGEAAGHRLAAGDVDQAAAGRLVRPPALRACRSRPGRSRTSAGRRPGPGRSGGSGPRPPAP